MLTLLVPGSLLLPLLLLVPLTLVLLTPVPVLLIVGLLETPSSLIANANSGSFAIISHSNSVSTSSGAGADKNRGARESVEEVVLLRGEVEEEDDFENRVQARESQALLES